MRGKHREYRREAGPVLEPGDVPFSVPPRGPETGSRAPSLFGGLEWRPDRGVDTKKQKTLKINISMST